MSAIAELTRVSSLSEKWDSLCEKLPMLPAEEAAKIWADSETERDAWHRLRAEGGRLRLLARMEAEQTSFQAEIAGVGPTQEQAKPTTPELELVKEAIREAIASEYPRTDERQWTDALSPKKWGKLLGDISDEAFRSRCAKGVYRYKKVGKEYMLDFRDIPESVWKQVGRDPINPTQVPPSKPTFRQI
jgi:hypothetical protein